MYRSDETAVDIIPPAPFSAMPLTAAPARVAAAPPPIAVSSQSPSLNFWAIGLGVAALPMVPIVVGALVMLAPVRWLMSGGQPSRLPR